MQDRRELIGRLRAAGCVFAEDEADLLLEAAASGRDLEPLVARRVAGEPLEHVLGWAEFGGLRVAVGPGVFVPRHRSEFLAELAADAAPAGGLLVELCCGVAAIACWVAARVPDLEVHAADIDPVAVGMARKNLAGVPGAVHLGDLVEPLPVELRGRVDVIVANAPYVPTGELEFMPRDVREHEPRHTLDGGSDGLDLHRRIAVAAPAWLRPGGALLIETGEHQASGTAAAMRAAGLATRVEHDDDREATVVLGRA